MLLNETKVKGINYKSIERTRTRTSDGWAVCARRDRFPGVRYCLEAILHCEAPLGARILSAVRNREVSASRRLFKYYCMCML